MSGWGNNDAGSGWNDNAAVDANSNPQQAPIAPAESDSWGTGLDNNNNNNNSDSWGGTVSTEPEAPKREHKFGKQVLLPTIPDEERKWFAAGTTEWEEGEKNVEIEKELYEGERMLPGINFAKVGEVPIRIHGDDPVELIDSFDTLDLYPELKSNILDLMKYNKPTPVQKAVIPTLLAGRDVMASAQTGSGKTAAYLIPIMDKLLKRGKAKLRAMKPGEEKPSFFRKVHEPLVLIISPTRELAGQIFTEVRKFAYRTWVKPAVIYGGANSKVLLNGLESGCDVLIATPGKLCDFLLRNIISLKRVKFLVIDEADRLFELGFDQEIRRIVEGYDMPRDEARQTALFSATFPKTVRRLARDFLLDCLLITVGRVGTIPVDITQRVMEVDDFSKRTTLLDLLYDEEPGLTLVFVNTQRAADTLDDFLFRAGFPVTSIHGKRSQAEREDAISAFRSAKVPILIATDVAARGLDIPNVSHVINYDMPKDIDEYIHRVGRTARVGNTGKATSFYNERNVDLAPELVRCLMQTNQEVPDFLEQFKEQIAEDGIIDELKEEDLEGDLPEGYSKLGEQPEASNDMDLGGAWAGDGGATGDAWGAGNTAGGDNMETTGGDAWSAPAEDTNGNNDAPAGSDWNATGTTDNNATSNSAWASGGW